MPLSPYLLQRQKQKQGLSALTTKKKIPVSIAKKSEKMKKEDIQLRKFVALFLSRPENKYCAIRIDENCTKIATTVNHKKRRGKHHKFNEKDCEPSCWYCNGQIENKDAWAREHGHLESVHKKTPVVVLIDPELKVMIVEGRENFKK